MSINGLKWLPGRLALVLLGTLGLSAEAWSQGSFGVDESGPAASAPTAPVTDPHTMPPQDVKEATSSHPTPAAEPSEAATPAIKKAPTATRKAPAAGTAASRRLTIHLGSQRFAYQENGQVVRAGPVSSGKRGYGTPAGSYRVLGKQRHKVSSRYAGSDGRPASMPFAIQFRSNYFIHQGRLPGYAASHGCVRLRGGDASFLFSRLRPGDPIVITR